MRNIFIIIAILAIVGAIVVYKPEKDETPIPDALTSGTSEQVQDTGQTETQKQNYQTNKKTTMNGMTIEILKEGTGDAVVNGQTAVVDYTGTLVDGTVFDSSIPRGQTFDFQLGAGQVIKGWDQGVLGMKVGEVRKLTIPSELAYGDRGAGGIIPPGATLIFEVTLRGIK